jgi:hypothetical protein
MVSAACRVGVLYLFSVAGLRGLELANVIFGKPLI